MTYGKRIKQARETRRMTQEQLAEQLDVSRQAVSKWEADLSRPTHEKLDRLSLLLDIPQSAWAEIDAEQEAASRPPDTSRPWKAATAVLSVVCVLLAVTVAVLLWPEKEEPPEDPPQETPLPEDPSAIFPDSLPLTVYHDFEFGDQPFGEYDPSLVPFLDDDEERQENTLASAVFGDTANHKPGDSIAFLDVVKANPTVGPQGATLFDIYLLCAVPDKHGNLEWQIMFRMAEANIYVSADPDTVTIEPFFNVLGHDGYKISITVGASGKSVRYITQRPDGTPCLMSTYGGMEADVDEDGVLEIVEHWKNAKAWDIVDTKDGEEGAFVYTLSQNSEDFPGVMNLCLLQEKGGFVVPDSEGVVRCRYVLRDGEMVRLPLTDFSVVDYPDAAGTKLTFITDPDVVGILTDGLDPDEILPYTEDVRITHRQQAYLALQELYNLTGLKIDECYCAANRFGVNFSLLPDGFDQRSFLSFDFNTRYGNEDNIPCIYISWQELGCDWSPLSLEDAVRPESRVDGEAETLLWYYDRMQIFSTGIPSYANGGELWLEDGDLYVYYMEDAEEYGLVLTGMVGPYPDGVVNH